MSRGPRKAPPYSFLMLEGRAVYELGSLYATMPWLLEGPQGDGHPVVVLPGFIASDVSTRPLRTFLHHRGYNSHTWKQGRNLGIRAQLEGSMIQRLEDITERYGRTASLIGWSLGGVYSRWLANKAPHLVRSVISLGSPFTGHPKATHPWRLYETISGQRIDQIDDETYEAIRATPPVPTTSIYSRTDGITSWHCCIAEETEQSENIEVAGSHCGLGVNPLVLHVIADRLAQPEGAWRRFKRSGKRRFFYRRPTNQRAAFVA
ncbi:MAG: alpha/beta hydrolase [Acidobacteriota bacterium]